MPDTLFEAAAAAANLLPARWGRGGPERLLGALQGVHGRYAVSIATVGERLFHVKVGRAVTPTDAETVARLEQMCVDANWQMPTAAFSFSLEGGGQLVNQASLSLDRSDGVPDPAILRNLVRECTLGAELIALVADAVVRGTRVEDARTFRAELFPTLYAGELGGLPAWLRPPGPPPLGSQELIDARQQAARSAGWETARNSPTQAVIVCAGSPATGAVHSIAGVHERSLVVTSFPFGEELRVPADRRPAVATLINRILEGAAPFGLALHLGTGDVAARTYLDLSDVAEPPTAELLCDVIFQSAAGAFLNLEPLVAVAHEGADPDRALAAVTARLADAPAD